MDEPAAAYEAPVTIDLGDGGISSRLSGSKLCRSCRELIDGRATKCPRCQSFQSPWMPWLFVVPAMIPLLFMIPILLDSMKRRAPAPPVVVPKAAIPKPAVPKVTPLESPSSFANVRELVTTKNARLVSNAKGNQPFISYPDGGRPAWVFVTVANNTDATWADLEFLVEFEDAEGNRIDLCNIASFANNNVAVQPMSELDFRLSCQMSVEVEQVARVKVTVTNAKTSFLHRLPGF